MSYSYKSILDGGADSDLIYYNASIVNNNSKDGVVTNFPPVKFNESRDAPIIKDASQYYFSVIRFAMNGPNKTLPLFIPQIQLNGSAFNVQANPNKTIYYVTLSYQREWAYTNLAGGITTQVVTVLPSSTVVEYRPQIQNQQLAPIPPSPITGITRQDVGNRYYWVYTYSHFIDLVNETFIQAMFTLYSSFQLQWSNLPNINLAVSPFPYPTFASFVAEHDVPFIQYNEQTELFEIYGDTRAFNVSGQFDPINPTDVFGNTKGTNIPIPAFVPPAPPVAPSVAVATSEPFLRLFMNSSLFGLFSSFDNTFYGANNQSFLPQPLTPTAPVQIPTVPTPIPFVCDYTYEILFSNKNYSNIENHNPTLQNFNAVPPPAYNPFFLIPSSKQNLYWKVVQDYNTTNSLWSPVSAIVFTSTLLPVKNEYTSRPNVINNDGNVDISTSSASAFDPIICDFVIDQQYEKAQGWRDFVLYQPTAEFQMASLTASHDEIRNIDIQVYWRHRLTNELIPMTMYNQSDVSIKCMFRKVDYRS